MAKDPTNRVKFQGMVSADTKRFLEVEWRAGKSPHLLTWNDVVDFCVESGHKALAEMNKSPQGLYVVSLLDKKRKKESEEAIKRIEYELDGWVSREEIEQIKGNITPLRRVDEG